MYDGTEGPRTTVLPKVFVRSRKTGDLVSPEQALAEDREMANAHRRNSTLRLILVVFAWMVVVGGVISLLLK